MEDEEYDDEDDYSEGDCTSKTGRHCNCYYEFCERCCICGKE